MSLLRDHVRKISASKRRRIRVVAGLTAAALMLVACGGSGGESDEATPDSQTTQTTAPTKDSLRIAVSTFGDETFDPPTASGSVFKSTMLLMYDTLLEVDKDGEFAPGIAESWEVSDDALTWTFNIRKGVQFHGGWGEVTAHDVVFTLKRFMDPASNSLEGPILTGMIKSLEATDDYTVVITTNGPQPRLSAYLSPNEVASGVVMSEKYLTEKGGPDFASQANAQNEKPIGSGPYQFVSHDRGQNIVYDAVENHWRANPAVKHVEFLLVPEPSTQVAMIQSGEADIVDLGPDDVSTVTSSGAEVRTVKDRQSVMLIFVGTDRPAAADKPTANVKVREALSYAIDRKGILEQVLGGYGSLPTTPYNTVASTRDIDEDHYAATAEKWQTYDPELAKKMLADAGYPDGFDGVQMFSYVMPGGGFLPSLVETIASEWKEVGVDSPLVSTEFGTFRPHLVNPDQGDAYNAGDPAPITQQMRADPIDLLQVWYWGEGKNRVRTGPNPELDDLIVKASAEPDEAARQELVSEAFDIIHDEWLVLPLFNVDSLFGVGEGVGQWADLPSWAWSYGRILETIK